MEKCNPFLADHRMGKFLAPTNYTGLAWDGFPFVAPFLRSVEGGEGPGFAFAGLGPIGPTNLAMPDQLLNQVLGPTNLVSYSWEMTGPRVEAWIYISQVLRVMSGKAQLPFDSASVRWLKEAAKYLPNCGTVVTLSQPDRLDFARKSSIGFSALELHLVADWLESPEFPLSLHTMSAPESVRPDKLLIQTQRNPPARAQK